MSFSVLLCEPIIAVLCTSRQRPTVLWGFVNILFFRRYAPWKNLFHGRWKLHLEDVQIVVNLTSDTSGDGTEPSGTSGTSGGGVGADVGSPEKVAAADVEGGSASGDSGHSSNKKKVALLEAEEAAARAAIDAQGDEKKENWFKRWVNSKVQQVKDSVLGTYENDVRIAVYLP